MHFSNLEIIELLFKCKCNLTEIKRMIGVTLYILGISAHFSSRENHHNEHLLRNLKAFHYASVTRISTTCNLWAKFKTKSLGQVVWKLIDGKFPDRLSGRYWPIQWLPRSPYVIPLNIFFYLGLHKGQSACNTVQDIDTPKVRITDVMYSVPSEILDYTWCEFE